MRPRHINFLSNAAASASGLFIPIYARDLGASTEQIGLIVGSFNAFVLFSNFLFGRRADLDGARKVLRLGLLLSALAALTQPLAFDAITLILSRAFLGFCIGMYPAALLAYATTADKLLGKFASYGSLGWALGNLLAGIVAQVEPGVFWQVFAISGGVWFLAFLGAATAPLKGRGNLRIPFFPASVIRRNVPVYLMIFIRHTGANMVWVILPIFLVEVRGFDDLQVGIIYALNPFVQFLVMQRIDRYRSVRLVVTGLLASFATFILLALARDFLQMLLTQVVLGFAWATLYVGSLKFLTETNPEVATAGGLFNSVLSTASIAGPILGGFLAALDYVAPMYVAAILSLVALVAYAIQVHLIRMPGVPVGINRG
jgi:MFS family permease